MTRGETVVPDEQMSEQTWREIAPMLDGLIEKLPEEDRQSVILRFFKQCSYSEVGQAIGISEEAARKRVTRSLEKLRKMLTAKGVAAPAVAVFSAGLLANATSSAPAAVATVVGSITATGAAATTSVALLAKGAITMAVVSKTKALAAAALLLLLIPTAGVIVYRQVLGPNAIKGTLGPVPPGNPDGTAQINLVDENGYAVADAEVYLVQRIIRNRNFDDFTDSAAGPVKTDSHGIARLSGLESAQSITGYIQIIYARVPGKKVGYLTRSIAASAPETLDRGRLPVPLYDSLTISGNVNVPDGLGREGLTAQLWSFLIRPAPEVVLLSHTDDFQRHFPHLFQAPVNSDGSYSLPDVPVRSELTVFMIEGPGLAREQTRVLREAHRNPVNVTMRPEAAISGTVIYKESNTPAAGVQLHLIPTSDSHLSMSRETYATTDAQGRYSFKGLAPGTYRMIDSAKLDEWTMAAAGPFTVQSGQTINNVDLRMEHGVVITGKVTGGLLRNPLADANIQLFNPPNTDSMMREITIANSGPDGTFSIRLPTGDNQLRINYSGEYRVPNAERTKLIKVAPDGTITGDATFRLQSKGPF